MLKRCFTSIKNLISSNFPGGGVGVRGGGVGARGVSPQAQLPPTLTLSNLAMVLTAISALIEMLNIITFVKVKWFEVFSIFRTKSD